MLVMLAALIGFAAPVATDDVMAGENLETLVVLPVSSDVPALSLPAETEALAAIRALRAFALRGPSDVEKTIGAPALAERLRCEEPSCVGPLTKALGARWALFGVIEQREKGLFAKWQLVDGEKAVAVDQQEQEFAGEAQLEAGLRPMVTTLMRRWLGTRKGQLAVATNETGVRVRVDGKVMSSVPVGLPMGVHRVTVDKSGFSTSTTEVFIRPGATRTVTAYLVPMQQAGVMTPERRTRLLGIGAIASGLVALGSVVGAFSAQALWAAVYASQVSGTDFVTSLVATFSRPPGFVRPTQFAQPAVAYALNGLLVVVIAMSLLTFPAAALGVVLFALTFVSWS